MRIMDWILGLVVFFAANWWAAYGIIAPLTVLRVTFPVTLALERVVPIDGDAIRRKSRFTLIFWGIVDAVVILLVVNLGGSLLRIFTIIGVLFALVTGLKKTGRNEANISDYYNVNYQYINKDYLNEAQMALLEMIKY